MFKPISKTTFLFILLTLVSACGPSAPVVSPTAMIVSSSPTAIPPTVTPIQIPPTATSAPTITPTQAPPTATSMPQRSWEKVATLDLPDSFVNTIVFSPDSQTMIAGDRNGEVLLWERDTWEKTVFLSAQSTYAEDEAAGIWYWGTLALSPDGSMIVNAYGDDGAVTGYDLTGRVMFTYLFGSRVWAVAISPDGRLLAVAGLPNNVVIIDLETYQQVANLISDYEYIFNLVFSPDGNTLVVGYERPGNEIKLWDTVTWQETSTFTHVSERIDYHDILFTADGTELVLATNQLGDPIGVRVWDLISSQIVREFPQNSQAAYQIALSPGGSLLASVHEALQLWNVETGAAVKTIQIPNRELGAVAFSPDGTLIAFSVWGEGIQVWSVSPAASNTSPKPAPSAATGDPDSTAITANTAGQVKLLRTLNGHRGRVNTLIFSGDGIYLASSSQDKGEIKLWDVKSGQEVHAFSTADMSMNGIAFSPDGKLLVSADAIWDVESTQVVHTLEQGREDAGVVAFSPDGSLVATSLIGQPIKLWDVASGQAVRSLEISTDDIALKLVFSIAFSPDGALLAAGSGKGTIRLWDVANGQIVDTLEYGKEMNDVHGVAFSPDGNTLASTDTDGILWLWDVDSRQMVHTLRHGEGVFGVAYSPDGTILATAGDGPVKLWDVASGQHVRSLPQNDAVITVAFSPDGALLISGGYDHLIYLWGIP